MPERTAAAGEQRLLSYGEAIREATQQEMARDERVLVMGQGVDDFKGFYGTTLGLARQFGADRISDLPLSEEGTTGIAVGLALAGLRPIHTHIRMDFLLLAMNQIVNIAAKSRSMYGGQVAVPLVIRCVIGRSWGQGAQHSQGLHALFMHIPGLRVVAPVTPYDAKGLLIRSIREDNPVLFIEHRLLHGQQGLVPAEAYCVEFGQARLLAAGEDVTLVGVSHAAIECLRARQALAEVGIDAEVLDPVSLSPLDVESIARSVRKTGRLLVVDSGWTFCGASAEIVTAVAELLGEGSLGREESQENRASLGGSAGFRFRRLGFAPVVCPTSKALEDLYYPTAETIASAAFSLVHGSARSWQPRPIEAPEIMHFKGPF